MQNNVMLQRASANTAGAWADYVEAQYLVAEGNRLVAQEIATSVRGLRRRVTNLLDVGRWHLPPT